MAKTIRFPLEMKDGVQVRTMGELKANWDVEKIVAHFLDGKLATWLRDRHFENEVLQVEALGKNDAELRQKLWLSIRMCGDQNLRITYKH